jgi:hypothetical protein
MARSEQENEEYLRLLWLLLRESEVKLQDVTRPLLLLLLWQFRNQLLATFPTTGQSRQLQVSSLIKSLEGPLGRYNDQFREVLIRELEIVDSSSAIEASKFAQYELPLTRRDYTPRKGDDLLKTTRASGMTLYRYLTKDARGISPFMRNHMRAARAKVDAGIMRGDSSIEIARSIVAERTVRGYIQPINSRGTLYALLRNRDTALIANTVWDVSGYAEREVFARQQYLTTRKGKPPSAEFIPNGWVWNAILDPQTCPICRPLHLTRYASISDAPYRPPVHPRCRCRLLPAQT